MKYNNLKGSIILGITAFIWGIAFVAQNGVSDTPPFLVNCLRSLISALFLLLIMLFRRKKEQKTLLFSNAQDKKTALRGGLICGIMLAVSVNFQQFGIALYQPGVAVEAHSGFITALYVVIVPIISMFTGKRPAARVWAAVGVSLIGFYLLCFSGGADGLYLGDLLVFFCAVSFSLHILSVDAYVEKVGGLRLSMLQFLVCGVISGVLSLIFELNSISLSGIISAAPQILYLGLVSSGIGYTLQIVGQRYAEPAVASLVMSMESVFAALGGWFVGNVLKIGEERTLSAPELAGCLLVFAAIVLAQLPIGKKKSADDGQ